MTDATSPLRHRALVWALLVVAWALGCAVSVPPSGGPEDKTPPAVSATSPVPDSAGVAADSEIRITFSEDMTRRGLERNLEFSPPVTIESVGWDGRTAVVRVEGGFHPDTTYIVTLKPGVQDNHRVASKEPYRFAFATSAALDTGSVEGVVFFRREPTATGVVDCYALRDTAFTPGATRPERRTATDETGNFRFDYLGASGQSYVLWAFEDRNKDGSYTPGTDVGYEGLDTVTVTAAAPAIVGVRFAIVDPDEPAVVRGTIINASGIDTMLVSVALFAPRDTVETPRYYTRCDTSGAYEWSTVRAGTYVLRAFIDMKADSVCGDYPCGPDSTQSCREPCVEHPDSVVVEPGDLLEMRPVELGPIGEQESE